MLVDEHPCELGVEHTGYVPPATRSVEQRDRAVAASRKPAAQSCTLRHPRRRPIDSSPFSITPSRRATRYPERDFGPDFMERRALGIHVPVFRHLVVVARDRVHHASVYASIARCTPRSPLLFRERNAAHVAVQVERHLGALRRDVGEENGRSSRTARDSSSARATMAVSWWSEVNAAIPSRIPVFSARTKPALSSAGGRGLERRPRKVTTEVQVRSSGFRCSRHRRA